MDSSVAGQQFPATEPAVREERSMRRTGSMLRMLLGCVIFYWMTACAQHVQEESVQTLHVALQDGFKNDSVAVSVNGKEAYRKADVTTNLSISLADQFDVQVEGRTAKVEVTVSSKGLSQSAEVQVEKTPYLAVSVKDGGVSIQPSREPFRYL